MNRDVMSSSGRTSEPAATIPAIPPGTSFHRLENGLEIIVREDHSAPVVSAQAWCRAGSVDEGAWMGAGLSHVLEHMLFKGTSTRGAGRIDQEVQAAGGYMNAYTSFDRTVYWISVPNTGATVAIDILCDIFQNATLPADELTQELDVIRREMAMGNDDPSRRASRGLFEAAYKVSPFRYPVIGLPDIFNRVTREDLSAYYTSKYAPNNCFFVVVGDISASAVIAQIRDAYSKSGARSVPGHQIVTEPKQTAPREAIEEAPVELGHFHFAWHVPDIRHPETPVLDVLASLLGSGRSSRLYRSVREKAGLVHSISSWIYNPGSAGIFGVSGIADGDKVAAAQVEILAEVERVKHELVSSAELAKAVKQFTVGTLAAKKTMDGQAQDLGSNWMVAHDLSFSERYLAAVREITPEDLRRVANQYLTINNRTTFSLLPTGTTPKAVTASVATESSPIVKYTLANGLRLLVKEDHRLPFVQFRAAFQGGLLSETGINSGITSLMAKLLVKGTATRSAEQMANEIESLGGALDPYSGNHSFGVSAEVLSGDFATGLDLFFDPILNPSFPEAALERERIAQLASIRSQRDQLLQCAFKAMRRGLFGENSYGLDSLGTEVTVRGFQTLDLIRYHQRMTIPNNAVISVFGDVQTEAVRGAVEAATQGWKSGHISHRQGTQPHVVIPRSEEKRDKEQAVLALGFPASTIEHPDRYALDLIQEACSDMGSRLFMRIRDELGLAYYVGATHFSGLVPGYFAFYCGTSPEKAVLVEEELRKQAELLAREGLSEEELSRAKAKLIGQRKISRQDLGQLAMACTLDELYGLGFDRFEDDDRRYEAVSLEEIRTVAAKYLVAERAVVAVVKGEPTTAAV